MLNGLLWAFLRRWYGGLVDEDSHPLLGSRGIQTVVMITSLFAVLSARTDWWAALLLAAWIQFQFWSRAVGEILDCGRSTTQTAASYNRWFRGLIDLVYDKLGKVKYVGYYDWWYGWLRYLLPMIIPAIILNDGVFIVIGLFSSPVYYGCWLLFDYFPALYKLPVWCGQPKNMAEIIYGFTFGFLLITDL